MISYILECFAWELKSQGHDLSGIPSVREAPLVDTWQKAFAVAVPWLWNKLSKRCTWLPHVIFRKQLKKILFRIAVDWRCKIVILNFGFLMYYMYCFIYFICSVSYLDFYKVDKWLINVLNKCYMPENLGIKFHFFHVIDLCWSFLNLNGCSFIPHGFK